MTPTPRSLLRSVQAPDLRPVGPPSGVDAALEVLCIPASHDRSAIRDRLARAGAVVSLAADAAEALQALGAGRFGLVVIDLANERSALTTVRLIRAQFPQLPIAGVFDTTRPLTATEAIYAGATDLLPRPFDDRDVVAVVAAARDAMTVDASGGRVDLAERLFEYSAAMRSVTAAMKAAAPRRTAVLVCGEPGSGRQLVARTLHDRDHDYLRRPLIVVDCAAEGPTELERRLFGAATDRTSDGPRAGSAQPVARTSAMIAAQGGSLLLAHVIDAPARIQARLAQVLRDREVFSTELQETLPLDIRPMAFVGPDVDSAVADGRLRRDLFERLAQVRIDVPPFRERREDLPLLAAHFLRRACEAEGAGPRRFSRAALALMAALARKGNAGEMADVIAATVRVVRRPVIQIDDLLEHVRFDRQAGEPAGGPPMTLREARARFERECISATLLRHHGRVGDAAKALGIQRTNLYRKVRQLNVSRALLFNRR